jgi:Protein of unknown function (DUF3619)
MNRHATPSMPSPCAAAFVSELGQERFARSVVAHLTQHTEQLPQDITERLRVAREQAVTRARLSRVQQLSAAPVQHLGSVLAWLGHGASPHADRWFKLSSVLPLLALLAGLLMIQDWHGTNEISAAAEIDTSLLADELPPAAYSDNGFLEYLKSSRE